MPHIILLRPLFCGQKECATAIAISESIAAITSHYAIAACTFM